jgi:hypothetical protein
LTKHLLILVNTSTDPANYEFIMISWIARGLLVGAGIVASWFIASDAPQFGLAQAAVMLILLVLIVAVLALWPTQRTIWINQLTEKTAKLTRRPKRK